MKKFVRLETMINEVLGLTEVCGSHEHKLLRAISKHGHGRIFGDTDYEMRININLRHGRIIMLMEAGHTGGTPPHFVFETNNGIWYYLRMEDGRWRL